MKKLIEEKRLRIKRLGYIIWVILITIGVLGIIFGRWYIFPISIMVAFFVGSIYSYYVSRKFQEETGLGIDEQINILKSKDKYNHKRRTKSQKIPITPWEVIKRIPEIPKVMEWSKRKHLRVSGPEFFGVHHIYIDKSLKHAVILLKADFTTHVFIGNPMCAEEWRKYDEKQNILLSQTYAPNGLEWKIYKDMVLYKGKALPPKDVPEEPYFGKIVKVEDFNDDINDEWIVSQIKELYKK